MIPRTHQHILRPILARNRWRRANYWHKYAKNFFLKPDAESILGLDRKPLAHTIQFIDVLALGRSQRADPLTR